MSARLRRPSSSGGPDGDLSLGIGPVVEVLLWFGDHQQRHVSMLHSAIFRALATIDARSVGADCQFVGATGDKIQLAGKTRDPERMDHIEALRASAARFGRPGYGFRSRFRTDRRIRSNVFKAPPPLQAAHQDRQVVMTGHPELTRRKKSL